MGSTVISRCSPSIERLEPPIETHLCQAACVSGQDEVSVVVEETGRRRYGAGPGHSCTKGRPGGNEPTGNLAIRSPCLNFSEASRNAATNLA